MLFNCKQSIKDSGKIFYPVNNGRSGSEPISGGFAKSLRVQKMSVFLPPDSTCRDVIGFSNPSGLDPELKSLTRSKNEPGFAKPPFTVFTDGN